MRDALVDAATCIGGTELRVRTQAQLLSGELAVPDRTTIHKWLVKLDMCLMLWNRKNIAAVASFGIRSRHLGADASPQAGYELLSTREEVMDWGRPRLRNLLDGFGFATRNLPLSALGLGKTATGDKCMKITRSMHLESGPFLPVYLFEVKSWLSDQAVESHMGETPRAIIPDCWPRSDRAVQWVEASLADLGGFGSSFIFPCALRVHDHMHIIFNALEKAITSSELWIRAQDKSMMLLSYCYLLTKDILISIFY